MKQLSELLNANIFGIYIAVTTSGILSLADFAGSTQYFFKVMRRSPYLLAFILLNMMFSVAFYISIPFIGFQGSPVLRGIVAAFAYQLVANSRLFSIRGKPVGPALFYDRFKELVFRSIQEEQVSSTRELISTVALEVPEEILREELKYILRFSHLVDSKKRAEIEKRVGDLSGQTPNWGHSLDLASVIAELGGVPYLRQLLKVPRRGMRV
jgi:hypothetical protein